MEDGKIKEMPVANFIAAVSVGIRDGEIILDLRTIFDKDYDIVVEAFRSLM